MRGDKSFAYDLFVPHRRVSSRVVLLLRSTERKRSRPRFVDLQSPINLLRLVLGVEGGLWSRNTCVLSLHLIPCRVSLVWVRIVLGQILLMAELEHLCSFSTLIPCRVGLVWVRVILGQILLMAERGHLCTFCTLDSVPGRFGRCKTAMAADKAFLNVKNKGSLSYILSVAENPCRVSLVWVNKSVPGRFGVGE